MTGVLCVNVRAGKFMLRWLEKILGPPRGPLPLWPRLGQKLRVEDARVTIMNRMAENHGYPCVPVGLAVPRRLDAGELSTPEHEVEVMILLLLRLSQTAQHGSIVMVPRLPGRGSPLPHEDLFFAAL